MRQSWTICCYSPQQNISFCQTRGLIKGTVEEWIENFPIKCQLFKTELQYRGNIIFIKDKRVCVKPLRSRIEVIQRLSPPTMTKGWRSGNDEFC